MKITETHASHIDELVTNSKPGELLEFGDIGLIVFGKKGAGGIVGGYIFDNRHRLPGWWRVVNWVKLFGVQRTFGVRVDRISQTI